MESRFYEYKGVTVYTYIYGCFLFYAEKDKYGLKHGPWKRMNFCNTNEAEQFINNNLNTFCW